MHDLEINKAIYNILINDQFIKDYNIGVYFNIPNNINFPYIYITTHSMNNISTKSNPYFKLINLIEIYTRNTGENCHLIIANRLIDIICLKNINLRKHNIVRMNFDNYRVSTNLNGSIINLSIKFESYVEVIK